MILIDTSAWIDFFRGHGRLADEVDRFLADGESALCGPIITEIRRGLASEADRRKVVRHLEGCHVLPQPSQLWEEAGDLGYFLARRGVSVKSFDLIIAAYALAHQTPLLTRDADFGLMRKAGVPLHLLPG